MNENAFCALGSGGRLNKESKCCSQPQTDTFLMPRQLFVLITRFEGGGDTLWNNAEEVPCLQRDPSACEPSNVSQPPGWEREQGGGGMHPGTVTFVLTNEQSLDLHWRHRVTHHNRSNNDCKDHTECFCMFSQNYCRLFILQSTVKYFQV